MNQITFEVDGKFFRMSGTVAGFEQRFFDAFCLIVWCKRRGIEKNQSFFQENAAYLTAFLQSFFT
ncbi:hypothetical protein IEC97_08355 [Neobacillus cucumis]|uniref:hypothetical protein n=1 Tax=Neobacillus cucumis TaxID=1740721 RepID=UPI0018DFBC8E|nr:hypothetical protein [Neobacillus cucumis]MBI0577369.1 hypothetical protein [Neobacillus cucumis]